MRSSIAVAYFIYFHFFQSENTDREVESTFNDNMSSEGMKITLKNENKWSVTNVPNLNTTLEYMFFYWVKQVAVLEAPFPIQI